MNLILPGDRRHPCCRDPDNLKVETVTENDDGKLIMRRCQVCQRRHWEAQAKPKIIGLGS